MMLYVKKNPPFYDFGTVPDNKLFCFNIHMLVLDTILPETNNVWLKGDYHIVN